MPPAPVVLTPQLTQYLASLVMAAGQNKLAAIDGQPGYGKTTLGQYFAETMRAQGRRTVYVQLPRAVNDKDLHSLVHSALTGQQDHRATARELREDIIGILHGSDTVLLLDEAHQCGVRGLQQVRYLHDRCANTFTLVLMGVDLRKALDSAQELRSRVSTLLTVGPLVGGALLATLKQYDPLLATAPDLLLQDLDAVYGHGTWRRWAHWRDRLRLLAAAGGHTQLDVALANDVLISLGEAPLR